MANKTLLIIAVLAIIVAIFFISKPSSPEVSETLGEGGKNVGDVAFDLSFTTFDGKEDKFSNYRGKVVIVNAWAAWCPFCRDEIPIIESLHKTRGNEVTIIGIHRTETESKKTGAEFAYNDLDVTYLLLQDINGEAYKYYSQGLNAMPLAVYIDSSGIIQERVLGPKNEEQIKDGFSKIISESIVGRPTSNN